MKQGELKRQYFIAAFPPEHATDNIKDLVKKGPSQWEWKTPDDYHISFAFPGRLTDAQVEKLISALKEIEHESFALSFEGLSFHLKDPAKRQSRNNVLWARPDSQGDNELRDLIHKVVEKLTKKKFRHGVHNISPHLTVARPPPEAGDLTKAFAKAHGKIDEKLWKLDRFYLCETLSRDDPDHPVNNDGQGSRYKKIAEFRLQPS